MSNQAPRNNDSGSGSGNELDGPRNYAYINPRLFPDIISGGSMHPPASPNLTTAEWLRQIQESRNPPRNRTRNAYSVRSRETYSVPQPVAQASWPYPPPATSYYVRNQPPAPGYAQNPPPTLGYYPQNLPLASGYYTTPSSHQLVLQPTANSYNAANSYAAQSSHPRLLPAVRRPKPHRPHATTSRPPSVLPNAMAYSEWITTPNELAQLLPRLNMSTTVPPHLYFDVHGINLGRYGSISIITLFDRSLDKVYFIDVYLLGTATFTTSVCSKQDVDREGDIEMTVGEFVEKMDFKPLETHFVSLKVILESEEIPKVFFDVRNDADALFSLYDIILGGVQDLQLMELATRHSSTPRTHLHSLTTCILSTLPLPPSHKAHLRSLKSTALSLFAPSLGGRYEVFNKRPLSPMLEHYCVQDVVHMPALWNAYNTKLWVPFWKFVVGRETEGRLKGSMKEEYEPNGEGKGRGWTWGFLREMEKEFNGGVMDESLVESPVGKRVRMVGLEELKEEDDEEVEEKKVLGSNGR